MYDIAIIGGAPAGLTAGIYTGRKKLKTVLVAEKVGGQVILTDSIENYPGFEHISGVELIGRMRKQAEKYGVEIREGIRVEKIEGEAGDFEILLSDESKIAAKAVIIASGKQPRRLGVKGEREFENKGVSFCSICDAPLFAGKDVAVVGGGNAGFESALDLTKYANKIYVLEYADEMRGDAVLKEKLVESGKVEFITKAEVKEIAGSDFVEKIIYVDRESGEEKELAVGGVFVNIGWVPATSFLENFVELDERGSIVIDCRSNKTSKEGVFAAGDATNIRYHQMVIAAGEGAKAALSAYDELMRAGGK